VSGKSEVFARRCDPDVGKWFRNTRFTCKRILEKYPLRIIHIQGRNNGRSTAEIAGFPVYFGRGGPPGFPLENPTFARRASVHEGALDPVCRVETATKK
jgi:hypothetical protein